MKARRTALLVLFLCAGCAPYRPPPPPQSFAGLPISGSLADAQRAGFGGCFNYTAIEMRCRRHNVMLMGHGPYEAAVDLVGGYGEGGFDQVTLWSEDDQEGVYPVTDLLEAQGWQQCMTGNPERSDQLIYTRPGSPVWITMDLSYWAKRRLRVIPAWNRRELGCTPDGKPYSRGLKSPVRLPHPAADESLHTTRASASRPRPVSSSDRRF